MPQFFVKDPQAVKDYKFDFANTRNGGDKPDWLAEGETITEYTITAQAGITVDSDALTDSASSVTAWLSGGSVGSTYQVTCHIVTSAEREDDATMQFLIGEQ